MKKNKYIHIAYILFIGILLSSCKKETYQFGDVNVPTNISVSAEIVGQDDANPFGDGSGMVNFSVVADKASSYVFYFDGVAKKAPSGLLTETFAKVGVHTYTVIVQANGSGGSASTKAIEVEVFSSFTDIDTENLLSGPNVGDAKKWYWQADKDVHVGLGPVTDDYGNGEFAYEAWWNGIKAWDEEKGCMYDNEFVFTRTADGITFEQTVGPAFVPGDYAAVLGVTGDQCHDATIATDMFGVKNVAFKRSTSKAAVEGSYNNEPYRGTTFEISDGGFMGWLVGSGTYDIVYITEDELMVRIIEPGNVNAWYHKFTSTKPSRSASYLFNDLKFEDNFDTSGAPDPSKWTYDLGAGGWGNGELQTYTNNLDNAIVEDGSLKIIAKANGAGYTSARLKTQGLYAFTYGRVEIRAKLPATQGTWPAMWMLGSSFPGVNWPACGEIDIMEQTGGDKSKIHGTVHYPNNSGGDGPTMSTNISNADTEFHKYTVEWTATDIKFFLDDVQYYVFDNDSSKPFSSDFFLILNVAMGGTLGGTIDPGFTEDVMEIDYVKVFQ